MTQLVERVTQQVERMTQLVEWVTQLVEWMAQQVSCATNPNPQNTRTKPRPPDGPSTQPPEQQPSLMDEPRWRKYNTRRNVPDPFGRPLSDALTLSDALSSERPRGRVC